MEIKRLVSKYVYRIEPTPEGGFIARASDPNVPPLEAATRTELQQKIQATVLAGLGADFPGLKLPLHSEARFSFHVEKQPDGSFDIHSSESNSDPLNAGTHDEVENHFAEKLVSFIGKHMLEGAPEALRAQLASGDIKVFVNKASGFTVTTSHHSDLAASQSNLSSNATSVSSSSSPDATYGNSLTPIDSSPITPVSEGSGKFLRILLVLAILAGVIFLLLHRR